MYLNQASHSLVSVLVVLVHHICNLKVNSQLKNIGSLRYRVKICDFIARRCLHALEFKPYSTHSLWYFI